MKFLTAFALVVSTAFFPALSQNVNSHAPGYCPAAPVPPPGSIPASGDFIELQRARCLGWCPAYTVRLYGDGRLIWHGEKYVIFVGDATASVNGIWARSLLSQMQSKGFWSLCEVYLPHATDGPTYTTIVSIAGHAKNVRETVPSDVPSWLRDVGSQIDSLEPVKQWIGSSEDARKQFDKELHKDH
jgi:hypothetical protein